MNLQEIEKLRKIYSDLKVLWRQPPLIAISVKPLQDLGDMLDEAIWERYNTQVEESLKAESDDNLRIFDLVLSELINTKQKYEFARKEWWKNMNNYKKSPFYNSEHYK